MTRRRIYLMRHGQVAYFVDGRPVRPDDVHLTDEGRRETHVTAEALAHLPSRSSLEVVQIGASLSPDMARTAKHCMKKDRRYRWAGSRPHAQALRGIASSHLLVVSSVMEGGANVICEASRIGVPVLASRVSGNVGMLGAGYPGYFPLFDERGLARLIARAMDDKAFYAGLKRAVLARRPLFAPAAERRGLDELLREFR